MCSYCYRPDDHWLKFYSIWTLTTVSQGLLCLGMESRYRSILITSCIYHAPCFLSCNSAVRILYAVFSSSMKHFSKHIGFKKRALHCIFPQSVDVKAIILWNSSPKKKKVTSFYLFLATAIKIMSCLSLDLFTAWELFLNDGMRKNAAHQQHGQTLQSVPVVSVLELEKKREKTGENRHRDWHETVRLERVWDIVLGHNVPQAHWVVRQ